MQLNDFQVKHPLLNNNLQIPTPICPRIKRLTLSQVFRVTNVEF